MVDVDRLKLRPDGLASLDLVLVIFKAKKSFCVAPVLGDGGESRVSLRKGLHYVEIWPRSVVETWAEEMEVGGLWSAIEDVKAIDILEALFKAFGENKAWARKNLEGQAARE